uniref:Ceramide kinase-like n=1 Tax=Xiphophorus maculatus TaxID=8083 RepID=A0A3B5QIU3_XIPMA
MRGIFKVGKKSHDVLLTRTRLTWTPIIPESPTGEESVVQAGVVLLQDVFAVKVKRRRMAGQQSGGAVLGLALFHSRRRGRRLEEDTLHLHNASAEHTHSWYNTLKELLTGFSCRPRYVKVFINPSSHKKEAVHIYRDHVAPLFKMADIRTDITGSTDVVSCSVHGVRDPVTAALHVVLGHLQQVDMCSFLSNGQLVRFGFSAMFGFGGRSLARAEKKRWMSSSRRREYAVVKTLESWVTNQGLYLSISIMSIPCLSPHAPQGLAPNTRYTLNSHASLIAVGNASRSEFIKHLKRYSSSSGQFSFPFVETHSVSAVKIRPRSRIGWSEEEKGAALPWNIDGELVEIANEVLIRWDWLVHPRLIALYGEEVHEAESTVTCSCI